MLGLMAFCLQATGLSTRLPLGVCWSIGLESRRGVPSLRPRGRCPCRSSWGLSSPFVGSGGGVGSFIVLVTGNFFLGVIKFAGLSPRSLTDNASSRISSICAEELPNAISAQFLHLSRSSDDRALLGGGPSLFRGPEEGGLFPSQASALLGCDVFA